MLSPAWKLAVEFNKRTDHLFGQNEIFGAAVTDGRDGFNDVQDLSDLPGGLPSGFQMMMLMALKKAFVEVRHPPTAPACAPLEKSR